MPQSNIVAVLIVRCTHTGVYADGRPNTASVTIYDLDEITIQKNRTRAVPVLPNSYVDIEMSTRTFVSWHDGAICKLTQQGLITSEIILQFRDKANCGGPAGTGQALRPAILNTERGTDRLRLVIPDNVIPTVLDSIGFLVGEPVTITGFKDPSVPPAYRGFNGEYVITTASPGFGLAGADPGSYLLEFEIEEGTPLPAITLTSLNLCLTEGRVVSQFNSTGDVGGLGSNVFGYVGGMLLPHAAGGGGTIAVFDEGVLIDAAVSTFDFIGAGVTASSAGAGAVDITIPGGGGGVTNLQTAYEGGNTIVTSATFGDLDVSGTEAISLDASQASNFTVDSASLTLSTTTSGDVNVFSVDNVLIDGADGVEINSTGGALQMGNDANTGDINIGTGAAARTITLGNSTGATGVTVNVGSGEFTLNSTVGEADPIATLTTTGANGDSIELFVGDNDPSGSVTGLAGSLFFRDTGAGAELYLNTSAGSGTTWSLISTGGGAGVTLQQAYDNGNTIVTSATEGDLDVSGTQAISLDASLASNFTVDGANLTLSTTTSGNVLISSADLMDVDAGASMDVDITGTLDVLATGSFSIDGTGASNLTTTNGILTLSTLTTGDVDVTAADAVNVTAGNEAAAQGNPVEINAGDGGGANDGGDVALEAGLSGAGATGDGGDVLLTGGAAASTNGSGGDLLLTTGAGTGTGAAGTVIISGPNDEDEALVTLTTTGTSGDSAEIFVGDNDPNGSVTGLAGSLFLRDTGAGGELYINTSVGSGTTWSQVSTGASGATAILQWGNASVGNSTASRVLDPGFENRTAPLSSATTAIIELRAPRAGTLRNLYIRHNNPGGTGAVITYTVYVNGVATAISAGLASTGTSAADTTNSVVVAAGDRIRIEVTKVAVAGGGSRRPEVTLEVAA